MKSFIACKEGGRGVKKTMLMLLCCAALLLAVPAPAEEEGAGRLLIAANDRLSLYLSPEYCAVEIEDALTGKTWSSTMNDETAQGLKIIPAQQKRITSLLAVNCTNSGLLMVALLADECPTATTV